MPTSFSFYRRALKLFVILATAFAGTVARAQMIFGVDAAVPIVDTKDIDTAPVASETGYEGYMMVQLRKESTTYVVLGYRIHTSIAPITATTTSTLQTNSPYGGFDWTWGNGFYSLGLYWSPYIQGDYTRTSDTETWIGSAFYGKLGFHPKLGGSFALDLGFSYFSANYSSKSVAATVSSVDTFSQTVLAPYLGLRFSF